MFESCITEKGEALRIFPPLPSVLPTTFLSITPSYVTTVPGCIQRKTEGEEGDRKRLRKERAVVKNGHFYPKVNTFQ